VQGPDAARRQQRPDGLRVREHVRGLLGPGAARRRAAREGVDGQALEARPAEGGSEALRHGPPGGGGAGGGGARKNSSWRDLVAG